MPTFILSGKASLTAGGEGEISIKSPLVGGILAIGADGKGKFEIFEMEIVGQPDFFEGEVTSESIKNRKNTLELPEPLSIDKGQTFRAKVKDLSGAANDVYVTLIMRV